MARLVDTDNYGRDYPDEKFYCLGDRPLELSEDKANVVADALNCDCQSRFCKVVSDNYVLQGGFEP